MQDLRARRSDGHFVPTCQLTQAGRALKDILSLPYRAALERFALSDVLLAFDFDGTLAPIVADPDCARMRAATRLLLSEVATRYSCIVVSGRAQADVARRLRGIRLESVIGNHGNEPRLATAPPTEPRRWAPILRRVLSGLQGVRVENKAFSVAVHYRQARTKQRARLAILGAASTLGLVRVIGGKHVVNILPGGTSDKGLAVLAERDRLRRHTAIYVGDDETDEDVFGLNQPDRLLTIRVSPRRTSQASYCLRNQGAVDELLAVLIGLRPGHKQVSGFHS